MQSSLKHHTTTRKSLEVIVPASEVDAEYNEVVTKISIKAKIPGFRPGKATRDIILSRYGKEVRSEVAESLVRRHFMCAAELAKVQPISRPILEKVELSEKLDGKFNIVFDVAPEIVIPKYKQMSISKKKRLISEDDVVEQLEHIRRETAKLIPIDDGVAEIGNYVTMDVTVKPHGLKPVKYKDQVIQLAVDRPFDAEILNTRVNDTKTFSVTIPADESNNAIAGNTVSYEVTVKDLRVRELSEINDDFAKDMGPYTTLDELKSSIRRDLESFAEKDAILRAHQNILENLLDNASFEVPNSMIEMQLDEYCQEFAKLISKQGVDPKQINWEAYRKSRTEEAERIVRSSYILQDIGNIENIQVTNEEINEEIRNFIKDNKIQQPFEVFRKNIEDNGAIDEIKGRVRTYKTLERILSFANVTEELLNKDVFATMIESERNRDSNISKSDHMESIECSNDEQLKKEKNNDDDTLANNCCHDLKCDHNHDKGTC